MAHSRMGEQEAGEAPEAQPFMLAAAPPLKAQARSWRFPLWRVWGNGSPEDITAAVLTMLAPYVAFGWNMKRALQRSFWREILKVVLILGGAYLGLNLAAFAIGGSCDDNEEHHGDEGGHAGDDKSDDDSTATAAATATAESIGDSPGHHNECRGSAMGGLAFIILALVVLGAAVVYAARRRRQMRAQFNIPGTFRGDVLTWLFLAPCALAQETRTLMTAQVHDGVWYGPLPDAAAAHGVPAVQQMEMV